MKKPREFYVVYNHKTVEACKSHLIDAMHWRDIWSTPDAEIIKVKEITNEPRTTKSKAKRAKRKTSRPERASSAGKARHKPRAKAVAGKGKAEVEERRKKF